MNRGNLLTGALSATVGVIAAVAIYLRPEGLKAPAWVAFAATAVFVIAGLVIAAIELRATRAYHALVVALILVMFSVAAWAAFGPGERACTLSMGSFASVPPDILCRSAFGVGALMLAIMLVVAVRFAAPGDKNAN